MRIIRKASKKSLPRTFSKKASANRILRQKRTNLLFSKRKYFADNEEERKKALAQSLGLKGVAKRKIKEIDENTFSYNDAEYLVLTDGEADELAEQDIINILDEAGITAFNLWYPDFVDESWFEEAREQSNRAYAEDISSESSDEFESRLVEECYEHNLIDDSDFETDEDGEPDFKICLKDSYDLATDLADYMSEGDAVQWYIDEFGDREFADAVNRYNLADAVAIKDEVVSIDGRGHILASYDGREDEEDVNGETYYIYRIN